MLYYLGSRLVGQTEGVSSQMRYLLTDRQGSVRAKTDANRVINYETVRGPYGSVLLGWAYQNGPALAGHMEDAISGLTYMEARYYDPVAMRFISPDSVGVSGSNGGNFNRYWYANNNPYTYVDPDGRACDNPSVDAPCNGGSGTSGAAMFVGRQLSNSGSERVRYSSEASKLAPSDSAGRAALKAESRARTPSVVRAVVEASRPSTAPKPGSGGRANVSNVRRPPDFE